MVKPRKMYDFVVVGSGPSAAAWVRSALKFAPGARILMLERGPYCKTDLLTERNPLKVFRDSQRIVKEYAHGVMQGHTLGGGSAVNNYAFIIPSVEDIVRGLTLDVASSPNCSTAVADYEIMVENLLGPRPPPHLLHKLLSSELQPGVEMVTNSTMTVRPSNRNKIFLGSPTLTGEGVRRSAFSAIIEPLWREHFNQIDVAPDAEVARIIFAASPVAGGEPIAIGVQGRSGESWYGGQVVVAGGAIESPALLMRSGIGPEAHLQERGVPLLLNNAHVGQHLRDKMLLDDMIITDSTAHDFDKSLLILNRIFEDGASVQMHRYDRSIGNSYLAVSRLLRAASQEGGAHAFATAAQRASKFLNPAGYNAFCFQTYFKMESEASVTLTADGEHGACVNASALFAEALSREQELMSRLGEIYRQIDGMRDQSRIDYTTTIPNITLANGATGAPASLAKQLRMVWHFAGTCRVGDVVSPQDFGVYGCQGVHVVDMAACRASSDGGTMAMAYLTGHVAAAQMLNCSPQQDVERLSPRVAAGGSAQQPLAANSCH